MGRYYADLNPSYGANGELRWAVFLRLSGIVFKMRGYLSAALADRAAIRMNAYADAKDAIAAAADRAAYENRL